MAPLALDPDALDLAFEVAARRVRAGDLPFSILGVANAAGTVRVEAVAGAATRQVDSDAVCLLASITKPIVATAALRLAADGVLNLRGPLADWLPELRDGSRSAVTPWHVLSHTTGLEDDAIEALVRDGVARPGLVARALSMPRAAAPGSRYRYATLPFELLALAMERAAGEALPAILERTVLGPLGMSDTAFDPWGAGLGDRVAPLEIGRWEGTRLLGREDARVAAALAQRYTALRLAGGGLWSTAADLLRLGRAMLRGGELDGRRVFGSVFVDLATRETTVDGLGREADRLDDGHYALGWSKPGPAHPASPGAFGHGGQSGTKLWVDPARDLVVVFLTGSWDMPGIVADEPLLAVYAAIR